MINFLKTYLKNIFGDNINDFISFLELMSDNTNEVFYDKQSRETPNILLLNVDIRE